MPVRLFIDACGLAKRYLSERGSEVMEAIVGAPAFRGRLFVCDRVEGEVHSAFNHSYRRGEIGRRQLAWARKEFHRHYPSIFAVVHITDDLNAAGIALLDAQPRFRLTYADAIHLAALRYIAIELPAPDLTLVTSDGSLKNVARILSVPVFDPEVHPLTDLGVSV